MDKLVEGLAEALEQLKASPQAEGDMVALYGGSTLLARRSLADEQGLGRLA